MKYVFEEISSVENPIDADTFITGNFSNKYSTRNPISRFLVQRFLYAVDQLVAGINPVLIHEVGCGEGELISRYALNGRILIASDCSEKIIEKAREIAKRKNVDISFMVKNIYVLHKEDSAPLILCCEVLEHLELPSMAVEILSRLARPYLIASVPREPLWRALNIMRGKYLRQLGNTPGHVQHFSKSTFVKLLLDRFDILRVINPLPWTLVLARAKEIEDKE
jgi:2-polyprenyl-3-methyl-5-hydroxy-6-metoxy-1,4-benzoquinol methylase